MRIVRYYPRAMSGDGGMTNAVREWAERAVSHGNEVTIAYAVGREPTASRLATGVRWLPLRHLGGETWLQVPVGLRKALIGADVLVLHSAWTLHNAWAGAVARQMGVPYILEPRGAYDPHIVRRRRALKQAWWVAAEQRLVLKARAVHVFFDAEREHLRRLRYRGDVVVAPNGVTTPDSLVWDGGSGGYLLWMGRFDPEHKGIDLLVRAMALLPERERRELRLHGPDVRGGKQQIVELVRQLQLQPWVTVRESIHGRAKFDVLAKARGFVYPSRWEGFGNSVAEAISLGVPPLVTPYPLGVFLKSRRAAIVAEPTPNDLARGLRELDSPEAAEVGRNGARVAREELSWEHVTQQWLAQVSALL